MLQGNNIYKPKQIDKQTMPTQAIYFPNHIWGWLEQKKKEGENIARLIREALIEKYELPRKED